MDHKENVNKTPQSDEWIKTISDVPIADLGAKKGISVKSPYAVPENPPEIILGEVLGSGPIIDIIGEGGFARVYKIRDRKLDMDRAVKMLLPTGKKEVSDRFLTEARITARLNHPNIVNVYRVDEWKGCPFIEMEYIEGKSLETLLKERGKFPVYAVCAVGIAIARALQYSHSLDFTLSDKQYKGVIHRDLKPANIMLRNEGTVKLMDFGIARPISTGLHTMGENIVGTLQYLAPEQLNHKDVDQRTDIYAVGAILYEQLCGNKAFPDEGLTDLVNKKANGIYKPFQEFPIPVPKKLVEIVDNCLKVDKEERYLNADVLLEALNTAYAQFSVEPPETALKNFMADPGYIPVRKREKARRRVPPKHNLHVQSVDKKPEKPTFRLPEFSLPSFPTVRLPKLPKLSLPKLHMPEIKVQKVLGILVNVINGIKDVFSKLTGHIVHFGNHIWSIVIHAVHALSSIRISRKTLGIILGCLGGGVVISGITLLVMHLPKETAIPTESKKSSIDTSAYIPFYGLALAPTVDSTPVKVLFPEIISPAEGEIVKSEILAITWHSMAESDEYILQIDTNGQFIDSTVLRTIPADTIFSIDNLKPATYHFRVGVRDSDEQINWSSVRVINFSPVYTTPQLVAPLQGDTSYNGEVTFRWSKLQEARSYQVSVAIDSNFQQIVFDTTGCRDTFVDHVFISTKNTFYWHVQADAGDKWSTTGSFVIYDKIDYCRQVSLALKNNNVSDAEKILHKIPVNNACKDTLVVRISEKHIENQNFEEAEKLLASITLDDMMVYYLKSIILANRDHYQVALNLLDIALNSKTLFTTRDDSSNVLYLRAKVAHMVYEDLKNRTNGKNAYSAWETVSNRYKSKQTHERYVEAVTKMNQLFYTDKIFDLESDTAIVVIDTLNQDSLSKSKKNKWWKKQKPK
ncbi:MAG: serine/threonine protein kinase [Fibrobacter sp.]|nr:serine/threonine protein kinase [Fibrobacter sp.]